MKEIIKLERTVSVVINERFEICYSNISKDVAKEYLKDFYVFNYLPIDDVASYRIRYHTVNISTIDLDKKGYYLILIQPYEQLYKYACKDILTGLYNRNCWEELLKGTIHHLVPVEKSLIMIDIDNLKYLNDKKGHLIGDKAVRIVGQAIRESIRESDVAVRYGADKFVILIGSTQKDAADKVIKRIKENISKRGKEENIDIKISAGIACCDCVKTVEDIIKMTDTDLYKEKRIKKFKEEQSSKKLKDLLKEIERLRDELNQKVAQSDKEINNEEMLKLSQKLDELIIKGLKDEE